jgi:hypothetical protein
LTTTTKEEVQYPSQDIDKLAIVTINYFLLNIYISQKIYSLQAEGLLSASSVFGLSPLP